MVRRYESIMIEDEELNHTIDSGKDQIFSMINRI